MHYRPELKYVFVSPRVYDLRHELAIYRYLNSVGITPYILAGEEDVPRKLREENITFQQGHGLPSNYDIMISNGCGYVPFERYWLERSMAAGRINIQANSLPLLITEKSPWGVPKRTGFVHVRDIPGKRGALNYYSYNKEVVYLVTGRPDWDYFQTEEFKKSVADVKNKYGDKLLVINVEHLDPEKETEFHKQAIDCAESQGFKVILSVHPGRKHIRITDMFSAYLNPDIKNYVLFAAASHYITYIYSSTVSESLLLCSKTGCMPLVDIAPQKFIWLDDIQQWYRLALQKCGKDGLDIIQLVYDRQSIEKFLSSDQSCVTQAELDKIFGWPKVSNYSSYFFEIVEGLFGKDEKKRAAVINNEDIVIGGENLNEILRKDTKYLSEVVDISFWEENNGRSELPPAEELTFHIKSGILAYQNKLYDDALAHFDRAIMFTGTVHFAFIQSSRAICYLFTKKINEADKCIYQSLFIEPENKEYQRLSQHIRSLKEEKMVLNH